MALYFLTYDLHQGQRSDYQKLYNELRRIRAVRILDSTWCFSINDTDIVSLRDHFSNFIDVRDRLIVSRIGESDSYRHDWASKNTDGTPKDLHDSV